MSTETNKFIPAEAFPPGDTIAEEIEARGWTQADLAEIIDASVQRVNEIIRGKRSITPETAEALGQAFGTGGEVWLNLQATYDLWKIETKTDDTVARKARLFEKAPLAEMIKRGWIRQSERVEVLEQQVRDFFGIKDLDDEPEVWKHASRKSTDYKAVTPTQIAWLFRAKHLAKSVDAERFTATRCKALLEQLRELLVDTESVREVPATLAGGGVRFVVIERLPRTKIDGACFWLDKSSPVIAMSMRFDRIDYFWHTLLHELAHVQNRDGLDHEGSIDDEDRWNDGKPMSEKRADRFAADFLIPSKRFDAFCEESGPIYRAGSVRRFATEMTVHPGIVVGQLHHRFKNYTTHRRMLVNVRDELTRVAVTDGLGRVAYAAP